MSLRFALLVMDSFWAVGNSGLQLTLETWFHGAIDIDSIADPRLHPQPCVTHFELSVHQPRIHGSA